MLLQVVPPLNPKGCGVYFCRYSGLTLVSPVHCLQTMPIYKIKHIESLQWRFGGGGVPSGNTFRTLCTKAVEEVSDFGLVTYSYTYVDATTKYIGCLREYVVDGGPSLSIKKISWNDMIKDVPSLTPVGGMYPFKITPFKTGKNPRVAKSWVFQVENPCDVDYALLQQFALMVGIGAVTFVFYGHCQGFLRGYVQYSKPYKFPKGRSKVGPRWLYNPAIRGVGPYGEWKLHKPCKDIRVQVGDWSLLTWPPHASSWKGKPKLKEAVSQCAMILDSDTACDIKSAE